MYVCMHVCICVCWNNHDCAGGFAHLVKNAFWYVQLCVYMNACVYVCYFRPKAFRCVRLYVCVMNVCMYTCMYAYVYVCCFRPKTFRYMQLCVRTYVCICVYVYVMNKKDLHSLQDVNQTYLCMECIYMCICTHVRIHVRATI